MSSDEDVPITSRVPLQANSNKKRRLQNQRACDRCRQKKIRCDGNPSGSRCSHCSSSCSECIFTEPTKTRGPPKRYVDTLETRLEKMEGMLSRLYPDGDFSQEMELEGWARSFQPQTPEDQSASHKVASPSKDASPLHSSLGIPDSPGSRSRDEAESDSGMRANNEVLANFGTLCISSPRYFGNSSGMSLLRSAMSAKTKASDGESPRKQRRPEFWNLPSESDLVRTVKRKYNFPEPELLTSLSTLFFAYVAPVEPLLHRPTFMNAVNDGLHLRDDKFGAIVLLVCATASRYSYDSRTFTEGGELRNAGWKWFDQVEPFSNSVLYGPELHDLQIAALSAMYGHGTLGPQSVWILAGIGLRLAQDIGAHCRRHEPPTVESELCKRAFWVLLMIDIWTSSSLGRCCAISEENYDVDLPIECDDEYWENVDPALAFKQPFGKPSQVSFFNHMIKINLLHSHALRTIYPFNKYSVVMTPREKGWEEQTVASLDSALNSWFDSVPDHLRWDPHRENQIFFIQSATLRIVYYFIQITIHRPFIPSFRKESSLLLPALAICASAARATSHVADALRKRYPTFAVPTLLPTFVAGVILLVSLWGAKRSGTSPDPERDMQDVRKCMKFLEMAEPRWTAAGRFRDLLTDLSTAGEFTVPADSPPSNKREREDEDDEDSQSSPTPHVQIHPHRSASQGSSPYPSVPTAQADSSAPHTPTGSVIEFTPLRTAAMKQEVQPNMPGYSVPPTPTNQVASMLTPKPYGGGYVPLYGSSGLGRMTPAISSTTPASVPPASSFGPTPSLSGSPSFSRPPTMYDNSRVMLPLSTGVGAAQPPGINMMLASNGLYDPATLAPPSAPASISSSSTSPHCGFQPSTDFGTSAGGDGVLDMSAMEMAFGGYSVPTADKVAMLRQFAPVLLQDWQIGVDRDTMMMWSEMPATFETHDWEAYMSNMLGLSARNAANPGAAGERLL